MDSKGRHAQGCKASLPSDEAGMGQGKRHKVNDLSRRIQESNPMRWRLVFFLARGLPSCNSHKSIFNSVCYTHAAGSFGSVTITWRRSVSKSLI